MRFGSKVVALIYLLALLDSPCLAQGVRHEDSIEQARKKIFKPDGSFIEPPVEPPRTLIDPFTFWNGPKRLPPQFAFQADVVATKRNLRYKKQGKDFYRSTDELLEFYLSLPPPPNPPPSTSTIFVSPNTAPFYSALLQFLQAGPGVNGQGTIGPLITLQHLQQIAPSLLSLAATITPTSTVSQVINSTQGVALLGAAQSILQPLNLWNLPTLTAWVQYVSSRLGTALGIVHTLQHQLSSALPTAVTVVTPSPPINTLLTSSTIVDILKSGDRRRMAGDIPRLADSLLEHNGFAKTLPLLYASRSGATRLNPWSYRVSIQTELRQGDKRSVYSVNEMGFFVNQDASGAGKFYQGADDASLVYVPIKLTYGTVVTLDVTASDRYALLKRMVGGNVRLLDRASSFSTALVSADVGLLFDRSLHLRAVAGSTPYTDSGGVATRLDYGDGLFGGHVGLAAVMEGRTDNFLGYFETENVLRTPYWSHLERQREVGIRTWASLTAMASVMTHRALGAKNNEWGLQAEARIIPEVHVELATGLVNLRLSAGVTTAIVPGGHLNLDNPEGTLGLHLLREHIEFEIKALVGSETIFSILAVSEFSDLVDKARLDVSLMVKQATVTFLVETESYKDTSFTDVRLGGGVSYSGAYVTFIKSLKDEDYRIEAGIDISSFWNGGEYYDD